MAALAACSSGGGDDAMKFAGTWTFSSGQLAATCPAPLMPDPFDLKGLSVSISKVSNSAIDLVAGSAAKCTVHLNVSGNKATATPANQTCKLDVGGALGEQTLIVKSWTLDWAAGHLSSTTSATVLLCMLDGSGVLMPGGPDGGVTPADGGDAKPAPVDTKPDLGTDVATVDAGTDADSDASDANDASADAGGDAG
jgi:hypothetical protein